MSSTGKHEADIPTLLPDDLLKDFLQHRSSVLAHLQTTNLSSKHQYQAETILPILVNIYKGESAFEEAATLIFKLEKKFILYGHLASRYTPNMVAINDETSCPDIYFVLAGVLLLHYQQENDLNSLNSAIRLIDTACSHILNDQPVIDAEIFKSVLKQEASLLVELSDA